MKARGIGTHHALLFEAWAHHLEVSGPKVNGVSDIARLPARVRKHDFEGAADAQLVKIAAQYQRINH